MCNYMKLLHTNPALPNRYSKCGTNIKICYLSDIRTQVEKLKQRELEELLVSYRSLHPFQKINSCTSDLLLVVQTFVTWPV